MQNAKMVELLDICVNTFLVTSISIALAQKLTNGVYDTQGLEALLLR